VRRTPRVESNLHGDIRETGGIQMISSTCEYALRAVAFLCASPEKFYTVQEIAESTHAPPGYLAKILQLLVHAKIIRSQRGIRGGFRLGRRPAEISVLDVLRASDFSLARIEHCPLGPRGQRRLCPLHKLLDDAVVTVEQQLARVSMFELVRARPGASGLENSLLCFRPAEARPRPRKRRLVRVPELSRAASR